MKYSIFLFFGLLILASCKNETSAPTSSRFQSPKMTAADSAKTVNSPEAAIGSATVGVKQILSPPFLPTDALGKTLITSPDGKDAVGIFRCPNLDAWKLFMSTMEYAQEDEILKSLKWEPTESWWTKRDVRNMVASRQYMTYKRSWKDGSWYFAFNPRNYEVYMWK